VGSLVHDDGRPQNFGEVEASSQDVTEAKGSLVSNSGLSGLRWRPRRGRRGTRGA
jgi:predicted amino acid dehydrogenase